MTARRRRPYDEEEAANRRPLLHPYLDPNPQNTASLSTALPVRISIRRHWRCWRCGSNETDTPGPLTPWLARTAWPHHGAGRGECLPYAPLERLSFGFVTPNSSIIHRLQGLQGHRRGEDPWCARWLRVSYTSFPCTTRKGVGRMSDITLRLPLLTMLILFVAATGDASQLGRRELAEWTGCRQAVQW